MTQGVMKAVNVAIQACIKVAPFAIAIAIAIAGAATAVAMVDPLAVDLDGDGKELC